jgi:hypothetical protein
MTGVRAMSDDTRGRTDAADLREMLLQYLQAPGGSRWPGADGLTVREVLDSYTQAAAEGRVPTCQQLIALRPDLAGALNAFFASPGC